ncbi:polysaccharide deacetylase family protein [Burkholderia pyrrocinia]|uniref:polysaccharide deacetylase family protein n=1 Tax=Burkholderia pyrrocinia TaxID=60550 RepID=UPI003D768BE8
MEPLSRGAPELGAIPSRRWPIRGQSGALTVSVTWHALALTGCASAPSTWPWWLAGTAINHAVVTLAGLWPRSSVLGPNWTQLPAVAGNANCIALTIDDGPDPVVTPLVLDLLDRYGIRATFFCIGERALRYPSLTREIVARGHTVENHSHTHRHTFSIKSPSALVKEVSAAQRALTELTGERPMFFRAPAGLRNVLLEPVLQNLDLRLVAWTKRGFDTREPDPERVGQRLLHNLAARDILLVHDGNAAVSDGGQAVLLSVLPRVVDAARHQGLSFVTLRQAFVDG